MSNKIVLHSSALLALMYRQEGSEVLKPLLKSAVMSSISVAEVLIALEPLDISPQEALILITYIISSVIPFTIEDTKYVSELKSQIQNKDLSLADLPCLSLGLKLISPIYTADKAWNNLYIENLDSKII